MCKAIQTLNHGIKGLLDVKGTRASSHKPKKKKKKKSKTPRSSSSSSSSQSMQLEQPELDDEDSAAASPPKKKSRTEGVSFHKTSGGRVSKPYQHRGDLYYNYR